MSETPEDSKPAYRPPGDRRPVNDELPLPKKTFVRRRPGGIKPGGNTPSPDFDPQRFYSQEPERRPTPHDLYLTYDLKGKLRTHTAYYAPPDLNPVVRQGKKKKPEVASDPESSK